MQPSLRVVVGSVVEAVLDVVVSGAVDEVAGVRNLVRDDRVRPRTAHQADSYSCHE
jgi:hypothetical protein